MASDPKELTALTADELLRQALEAAVRLALIRHNIELEPDTAGEEEIAADAAGACFGEETCNDEPIPEVSLLLRRLAPPPAQPAWVIVANGEGAQAQLIHDADVREAIHRFMCCCGKPWRECATESVRDDIAYLDDPDNWQLDENGKQFSITWRYETGNTALYWLQPQSEAPPAQELKAECELCEKRTHPLMWHKGRLVHHITGKSGYYPCSRFHAPVVSQDVKAEAGKFFISFPLSSEGLQLPSETITAWRIRELAAFHAHMIRGGQADTPQGDEENTRKILDVMAKEGWCSNE